MENDLQEDKKNTLKSHSGVKFFHGGSDETRTRGLLRDRQAL